METKEKKEQISKQSKKGQKNGTIEREKGKGKKIVPQKLQRLKILAKNKMGETPKVEKLRKRCENGKI